MSRWKDGPQNKLPWLDENSSDLSAILDVQTSKQINKSLVLFWEFTFDWDIVQVCECVSQSSITIYSVIVLQVTYTVLLRMLLHTKLSGTSWGDGLAELCHVGLCQHSYPTLSRVSTGMDVCLQYLISHIGYFSLAIPPWVDAMSTGHDRHWWRSGEFCVTIGPWRGLRILHDVGRASLIRFNPRWLRG